MHKRGFLIGSAVGLTLLAGGMIPLSVLEVKEGRSGEILYHQRAVEGDAFLFRYTHSVEKTPVEGTFLIEKGGNLRLVETRFASYGAGLSNPPKKSLRKDGWFVTEGEEQLDKLSFFFSQVNRPVLTFKGKEVPLGCGKKEGGLLEISIRHYPLIRYLLKAFYGLRLDL